MTLAQTHICGMNFHYFRHGLDRFLDDAETLGLPLVEIWGAAPHFYLGDRTLADARALGANIRARGMAIICFTPEQCVYPINLGSPQAELRDRSIRYFLESLEMSVEMGSPALLVTPGSGFADQPRSEAFERCVAGLQLLADRAGKLGQKLFLKRCRRPGPTSRQPQRSFASSSTPWARTHSSACWTRPEPSAPAKP
jgi:protein FrlC